MAERDWEAVYQQGDLPWDTGEPDPDLARAVREGRLPAGRALEIGCGTGTNARFLAREGYAVVAVDFAPTAVAIARERLRGEDVRFEQLDIQQQDPPAGPYDLVFDRGCFHVFDEPQERETFARRVASVLRPGGLWLSLVGSTEGAPRESGPPRRSARERPGRFRQRPTSIPMGSRWLIAT